MNEFKYLYKIITYYMKRYVVLFCIGLILSIIFSLLTLINPILTRIIINKLILESDIKYLPNIIYCIIALIISMFIIGFLSKYIVIKTYYNISNNIKKNVSINLMKSEIIKINSKKSGDFSFLIFKDIDIVQKFLYQILLETPIKIIMFFILIFIMIKINYILSIIVLAFDLFQFLSIKYLSKKFYYLSLSKKDISQRSFGYLTEYLSNIFLIKNINFNINQNYLMNEYDNLKNTSIKLDSYSKFIQILFSVLNNILSLILLLIGIMLIYTRELNLGVLLEFIILSSMFYPNMDFLMKLIPDFQEVKSSINRLMDNNVNLFCIDKGNKGVTILQSYNINLLNVRIKLNEEKYIGYNGNICFKENSLNLISGENGAGKTTLCSVISKLNNNYLGKITIDKYNIKDISDIKLKESINWVVQNSYVLSGSIYENICSFNINKYKKEYVIKKLEKYDFYKYFKKFSEGLDTYISENGTNISKGEAQKIAIARIIVQQPPIIILDEPISFLDYNTKIHMKEIIKKLKNKSNIIMIIHDNFFDDIADAKYLIKDNVINKIAR